MLIVTRNSKPTYNEIVIGEGIVIKVLEIVGSQVKIGIHAPKEVPVYRKEIYNRIKREQDSASI